MARLEVGVAIPNRRLWVIGGVVLVGVILLTGEREDEGDVASRCEVEVTADVLNVRGGAGTEFPVLDQLRDGATIEAMPVVQNDFRQLSESRWVASRFLAVTEGSECG